MFEIIIILGIITLILWAGYKITGALFLACIWLFIKVPCAIILLGIGILCCLTILFIPVGVRCFKIGLKLFIP